MQYRRQGPQPWQAWVPLLLLGGLLMLEPQIPVSPGGHRIVQLALTLLMFGVMLYWVRRQRGALINEDYERAQAQTHRHTTRQPRREFDMDDEPWDAAERPWHSHGYDTDVHRRS